MNLDESTAVVSAVLLAAAGAIAIGVLSFHLLDSAIEKLFGGMTR
ncbi:MAG: hypothetical protein WBD41_03845 [Rhodococcus sp. (in: high G+C Gram-positive bacteria)]